MCIATHGLAYFAFARHYLRNLVWFLFLALLRCFSSGGSPHTTILFIAWCISFSYADCSIRTSTDQCLLTTPRSFSQLTTSFFGSQCQGILHMLFFAWTTYCISFSWYTPGSSSCLNCCVFILAVLFGKIVSLLLPFTEKPDFDLSSIS